MKEFNLTAVYILEKHYMVDDSGYVQEIKKLMDGKKQISEYLDYYGLDTGYMLSFNFNQKKEQGVKRIQTGDRVLFEGTV